MAISSLSRFTVPVPGGQSATSQGLLMPKLKYRFRVLFDNFGVTSPTTEMTKQVMTFNRPQVTFDDGTIDVYNSRIYYAGKHKWSPVQLTVRDDVGGKVSRLVGEQLQKQFDFLEQVSAASGSDYKFTTHLQILDGGNGAQEPNILEQFDLYGCYIKEINYNELSYAESSPVDIQMQLQYDNAIQVDANGNANGIGTYVGRALRQTLTG